MKHALPFLLVAALLAWAAPSHAQDFDDPISTDRPGFGFTPSVIVPGRVQIEAGTPRVERTSRDASFQPNQQNNAIDSELTRRLIFFPTLLRVGLADRLELRVSSGVYSFFQEEVETDGSGATRSEQDEEGFPGFTVGAKVQLVDAAQATVSLIPRVALPLGDDRFTNSDGRLGFSADAVVGTSVGDGIGLGFLAGGALSPSGPTPDGYDYQLTGTFSGQAGTTFDQFSPYVEAAFVPREDAENGAFLGGGLAYQPVPTAQLDVFFDRGLTSGSSDWLFGGGVSIRFGD